VERCLLRWSLYHGVQTADDYDEGAKCWLSFLSSYLSRCWFAMPTGGCRDAGGHEGGAGAGAARAAAVAAARRLPAFGGGGRPWGAACHGAAAARPLLRSHDGRGAGGGPL
jgi:hypothetical protein